VTPNQAIDRTPVKTRYAVTLLAGAGHGKRYATMAWPGQRWTQERFEDGAWLTDQP